MEILILLGLILLNGLFALSEMAIVSSRKAYLQERLDAGQPGAEEALELLNEPNRFFSTVQVGITLIGIVSGAFGGAEITEDIANATRTYLPQLAPYAHEIGFGLIVSLTTYLSLVVGELVPKRIALNNPESVAVVLAPAMRRLSRIAAPLVWLLSKSTEFLSRVLGIKGEYNQLISDFEIIALMREGIDMGEFAPQEHAMVKGALELDDIRVRQIITPRTEMMWLDVNDSREVLIEKLKLRHYSMYPVRDGDVDKVLGMVVTKDLLLQLLNDAKPDLHSLMQEALYVPETAIAADVLQQFKKSAVDIAVLVDEHGGIAGMLQLNDILETIVGNMDEEDAPVQRADGSWLLDGLHLIAEMTTIIPDFKIPEAETGDYNTLAGFVLARLGHIPQISASFEWEGYRFEVMDMDRNRIDKVLISRQEKHHDER
jgi:putative hemolysin